MWSDKNHVRRCKGRTPEMESRREGDLVKRIFIDVPKKEVTKSGTSLRRKSRLSKFHRYEGGTKGCVNGTR